MSNKDLIHSKPSYPFETELSYGQLRMLHYLAPVCEKEIHLPNYLMPYINDAYSLISLGYLGEADAAVFLKRITVPELKAFLQEHGQSVAGKKDVLIQRVISSISAEDITSHFQMNNYYTVTPEGQAMMEKYPREIVNQAKPYYEHNLRQVSPEPMPKPVQEQSESEPMQGNIITVEPSELKITETSSAEAQENTATGTKLNLKFFGICVAAYIALCAILYPIGMLKKYSDDEVTAKLAEQIASYPDIPAAQQEQATHQAELEQLKIEVEQLQSNIDTITAFEENRENYDAEIQALSQSVEDLSAQKEQKSQELDALKSTLN